jgi:GPH family glycoside/pentoside/hexuronide:cation symporter
MSSDTHNNRFLRPADRGATTTGGARDTRPEDRVALGEKTALGAGYLPAFLGNAAIQSLAIPFYQMTLHMDPAKLTTVLALPRLWDAVTDPVAGYVSDNLHTKWGRRRPMIFIGAILQAFFFGLIWMAPVGWSDNWKAAYLLGALLLFYTCYAIFSVPLYALTYEMTPDYKERTRVTAFAGFFNKVGEIGYCFLFPLAGLAIFGGVVNGMHVVGWGTGLVFMGLCGIIPALFVKERYYNKVSRKQEKVKFLSSFKASMQSRAFMVLVGLTICQVVAGMFASSTDYYLIVYYMFDGDIVLGSQWKAYLSVGYAVVGIASIYPVNWMANRYGKRRTLSVIFAMVLFGALGQVVLLHSRQCVEDTFRPPHLRPDLDGPERADALDARRRLRRGRAAQRAAPRGYAGRDLHVDTEDGLSASVLGMGIALEISGFDAALGGAQTADSILTLRLFLAISTAVWAGAAIVLLFFYPITQKRAYEIRDSLEAKRGTL